VIRPYGASVWDDRQTRRAIKIRTVKPRMFEGAYSALGWHVKCTAALACGGVCCLAPGHVGGCECGGDTPGEPGSCPA
jgi:hypothetical protein